MPAPYSVSPEYMRELIEVGEGSLHEAHAMQSLGRWLHVVDECLDRQGIFAMERKRMLDGLRTFLACLVRRVVPGAAANFIAQLPSALHEELFSQPAGPDVTITRDVVERALRRSMFLKDEQRGAALEALAEALTWQIPVTEIQSLCKQLPANLRGIFDEVLAANEVRIA